MSEGKRTGLKSLLLTYLAAATASLSKAECAMGPYMMARLIVEYVTSSDFWTEGRKKEFAELLVPVVKAWYEGKE
jgi:hypothetical protein